MIFKVPSNPYFSMILYKNVIYCSGGYAEHLTVWLLQSSVRRWQSMGSGWHLLMSGTECPLCCVAVTWHHVATVQHYKADLPFHLLSYQGSLQRYCLCVLLLRSFLL